MKRQKLSVVAAVILLLAGMIIGCDTAANSGSGGTVSEADLYGTWRGTVDIKDIDPIPVTVEFKENKYKLVIYDMDLDMVLAEGIWELVTNNTIIVSSEDGSGSAELSYELNNNKLKIWGDALSQFWGDSDIEITLSRTVSESDLYGTWTGTVDTGIDPIPVTVKFQVNKMYKIVIGSDSLWFKQEGIWELGVNNTIIVSSEDGIESAELSYKLNNNKLKIWGEALSEWSFDMITQLDLTRK